MVNPLRCYSGNGTRMRMGPFNYQPLPFIKARAYIAHYYTQSEDEHIRRKNRMLDDGSVNKHNNFPNVHNVYNTCINNQMRNKYSESIKLCLKEHGIEI
jgi:hypothetical protein